MKLLLFLGRLFFLLSQIEQIMQIIYWSIIINIIIFLSANTCVNPYNLRKIKIK